MNSLMRNLHDDKSAIPYSLFNSSYTVGEKDIGAPKKRNNFCCTIKMIIFPSLYCSPYTFRSPNIEIAKCIAYFYINFVDWIMAFFLSPRWATTVAVVITLERATKKRSKEKMPKMKQRKKEKLIIG